MAWVLASKIRESFAGRVGYRNVAGLISASVLAAGCGWDSQAMQQPVMAGQQPRSALRIALIEQTSSSTAEQQLLQNFAEQHGWQLVEQTFADRQDALMALQTGTADLLLSAEPVGTTLLPGVRFGPGFRQGNSVVVCLRDQKNMPRHVADLASKRLVVGADHHVAMLRAWGQQHLRLGWTVSEGQQAALSAVARQDFECALADVDMFEAQRRYWPALTKAFHVPNRWQLAWPVRASESQLRASLDTWFEQMKASGQLVELLAQYQPRATDKTALDYVELMRLHRRIRERLPRYQAMFKKAAKANQYDWVLLAAQAYQESHWNPKAKSPTGVRGIMMLTRVTAKSLGVSNRINAKQSIDGGARYLRHLHDRLDPTIVEPDRTWLALAAYNVGMAHIHDAQLLARRLGKNPHSWQDMQQVLPLLAQASYHKTLKHGYARGHEPVTYVQRIREYVEVIAHQTRQEGAKLAVVP